MAHVHKLTYTRPIPPGAERIKVKGVSCVRWRGRSKEWQVAPLLDDDPTRCRVETTKWYVTYTDPSSGKPVTVQAYSRANAY